MITDTERAEITSELARTDNEIAVVERRMRMARANAVPMPAAMVRDCGHCWSKITAGELTLTNVPHTNGRPVHLDCRLNEYQCDLDTLANIRAREVEALTEQDETAPAGWTQIDTSPD